jgi:hypothetical protein
MTSNLNPTLSPESADWLSETFARNRATFGGWLMEGDGGDGGGDGGDGSGSGDGKGGSGDAGDGKGGDKGGQSFTQADVDRIVKERVTREKAKYADYDDLKKKAGESATAEERIAGLEKEIETTKREALRRRVQAAHQISDEDADLFLTGADEETLSAQAKRLADRESERKKNGNRVSSEGRQSSASKPSDEREAVRSLFGAGG